MQALKNFKHLTNQSDFPLNKDSIGTYTLRYIASQCLSFANRVSWARNNGNDCGKITCNHLSRPKELNLWLGRAKLSPESLFDKYAILGHVRLE